MLLHTSSLWAGPAKLGNFHSFCVSSFQASPNSQRLLTAANNLFLLTHPKVAEKTWQTCLPAHLSHLYHPFCVSPFSLSFSQRSVHRYIAPPPILTIDSGSCPRLPSHTDGLICFTSVILGFFPTLPTLLHPSPPPRKVRTTYYERWRCDLLDPPRSRTTIGL